jgi:hypothetical protein
VLAPASVQKKRKIRALETWDNFRAAEGTEATHRNGQRLWYCKHCNKDLRFSTIITTNARRHLRSVYRLEIESTTSSVEQARQQSIDVAFAHTKDRQLMRLEQSKEAILRSAINPTVFYEAQIQLITRRRLPYNCVNWSEYQTLLVAVNYTCEDLLI